jgi:hypothetical protein
MWISGQHQHRPLYPRKRNPVPILQEAGWVPGPSWTRAQYQKKLAPFTAEAKDVRIIDTTSSFLHDVLTHTAFALSPYYQNYARMCHKQLMI